MKLWRIEVAVVGKETHYVEAESLEEAKAKISDETLSFSDYENMDYWGMEVTEDEN